MTSIVRGAANCLGTVVSFVYFRVCVGWDRSTSPPGGNQVDGLPPALSRFAVPGVVRPEILEICEFVWSNRIFPEVFSAMAFDWSHQIVKRICNEGAEVEQGVVPWNRKISKIENFMKYTGNALNL